jgi:hypothetical protein
VNLIRAVIVYLRNLPKLKLVFFRFLTVISWYCMYNYNITIFIKLYLIYFFRPHCLLAVDTITLLEIYLRFLFELRFIFDEIPLHRKLFYIPQLIPIYSLYSNSFIYNELFWGKISKFDLKFINRRERTSNSFGDFNLDFYN